jgi:hypothetical protein
MVKHVIFALALVALLAPSMLSDMTSEGVTSSLREPSMGAMFDCPNGTACDSVMNCEAHCSAATITPDTLETAPSVVVMTSVPRFTAPVPFTPLHKPPPRFG